LTTLQALRIYGPLTLDELARRCRRTQVETDVEAWRLDRLDLARICTPHPTRPVTGSLWDVTPEGRDEFDADCAARREAEARLDRLRRRDAACEGVGS
jgi:hypothetical protein